MFLSCEQLYVCNHYEHKNLIYIRLKRTVTILTNCKIFLCCRNRCQHRRHTVVLIKALSRPTMRTSQPATPRNPAFRCVQTPVTRPLQNFRNPRNPSPVREAVGEQMLRGTLSHLLPLTCPERFGRPPAFSLRNDTCSRPIPVEDTIPMEDEGFPFLAETDDMLNLTEKENSWPTVFKDNQMHVRRRNHPGATTSWIWSHGILVSVTYFTGKKEGETEDKWLCCHCKKYPALYDKGSTTKPGKHLNNAHNKFVPKKEPQNAPTQRPPVYVPDPIAYAEHVVKLVAVNHCSFQLIESDEWKNLIRLLIPDAFDLLPRSADWVRNSAIRLYNQQKLQISNIRASLPYRPSLSFDAWSSPNNLPMLAVVGYWYDGEESSSCVLMGLREIDGSHTGTNLATIIEQVEEDYEVKREDVVAHVGDNAANNGTTLDALGDTGRLTQVRCIGHTMNLGGRSLLNSLDNRTADEADETIMGPISKIRQLAIHVHRSPPLHQLWLKCFKNNIARDNKTRWNSTLTMLDSVLKQTSCLKLSDFLNEINIDTPMRAKLKELVITQDEWNVLENAQKFLKPLKDATMKLQGAISLFVLVDK
jgi:hypothetical protein